MRYLESQLGTEAFNKAMQEYFRRWQFKHPQPEDFKKANIASIIACRLKSSRLPKKAVLKIGELL